MATATRTKIVDVGGVNLHLGPPDTTDLGWIGQDEILRQLLACWLVVDPRDRPLSPRLIGPPGIGKTTLAMAAAKLRKQSLYINQCTADTRPEDLLVTPVLAESGKIAYHASPLVAAMLTGGVCVLDEGNRMNEKSWASLAPLLDHRRYVESVVAGISIPAHPDFRCCVTMNEDESTYEVPDYILSRLQPTLTLGFPARDDELAILKYHLPFASSELLALTVDFLQQAHELKLDFSPRDGINLLRFAIKRMAQDPDHPLGRDAAWREALYCVLGDEAADLEDLARRKRRAMGSSQAPMGLGDLFFDPGDPLHPDAEDEDEYDCSSTITRTRRVLAGILQSQSLRASTKARNPKDVRYGNGQYLSDIPPGIKTAPELARMFLNLPFLKSRYTHYIGIDVSGLSVIQGRVGVYVILNEDSLSLSGRIVDSGENRVSRAI